MENYKNLSWGDIKAMYAETDRRFKETDRLIKNLSVESDKTEKMLKELSKNLGGISNSNGEMAEEYFFNAFKADKTFANEKFIKIRRNLAFKRDDVEAEFDLLLFNGKSAAIIEVKYSAKPENISVKKIISRVGVFKILYPEFKTFNIYLGVAAMSFRKGLEQRLHRNGIATIRPIGKKMVKFDKDVKVF